ncbi:helix-turn-helix transcriptional regulator [Streptomyces sp. G-G2]|uniref:helix-turn-helix domain-containing protein n=1 Tax=Streptomyces sp. G-G2 TaxID=3046201 RepID=UPI0024B8DE18|nr:helix-turn-helix transcriptional regulator [Streptomyces sp. G-G2]MDJ0382018.1 helix-turn-helix transcriptional regulator [Streptomyces sp. G-G2]
MGRPQKPVPRPTLPSGLLAAGLRDARAAAGLTYVELAARAGYSRSTLQRAASGIGAPPRSVVEAYASGCGVDPAPLLALREKARVERETGKRGTALRVPGVRHIMNEAELGAALYKLHVESGMPTYRDIEARTTRVQGIVRVSKTAAQLLITRRRIPSSPEQLKALLFVYGVRPAAQRHWLAAWSRVERGLDANRASVRDEEATARARRDRLARLITATFEERTLADHGLYQDRALHTRSARRGLSDPSATLPIMNDGARGARDG